MLLIKLRKYYWQKYQSFWQFVKCIWLIFETPLTILYAIDRVINAQYWTINLAIWSHCSLPIRVSSWQLVVIFHQKMSQPRDLCPLQSTISRVHRWGKNNLFHLWWIRLQSHSVKKRFEWETEREIEREHSLRFFSQLKGFLCMLDVQ